MKMKRRRERRPHRRDYIEHLDDDEQSKVAVRWETHLSRLRLLELRTARHSQLRAISCFSGSPCALTKMRWFGSVAVIFPFVTVR